MLKHIKVVFVLGGPGSGKHTQCQLIEKKFKWKHISAGHLLRDEIRNPLSKYGGIIEEIIYDGKIVPSHITTKLLHETIQNNQKEVTKFLIDGYPRNLENLTSWINESKDFCDTSFILHFRCSEEEMIKRVLNRAEQNQRSDDTEEIVQKRLRTYYSQTKEVIDEFEKDKDHQVYHIDADGAPSDIFKQIEPIFESFQAKHL